MAAASERWRVLARAGEIEYDRVLFFSDAVFAIAITLLIVDLRVPDVPHLQSGQLLRHAIPQIGGFAYSFAAIGLFWLAHHGLFRHIKGLDRRLVLLNLLFLGTIAFVPYPTALLSARGLTCATPLGAAADPQDPGDLPAVDPGRGDPAKPGQVSVAAHLRRRVCAAPAGAGRGGAGGGRGR
jgi:hypothetical protein